MYKIFLDKKDNFKCNIQLEGASLSNASPRLILENNNRNLIFYGDVNSLGECTIPITGIKGILKENDTGNIKLEVIADDTYFNPWNDEFITDVSKKIKVEVTQNQAEIIKNKKNKMVVEVEKKQEAKNSLNQKPKKKVITTEQKYKPLLKVLKEYNITKERVFKNKEKFLPVIKEYFNKNNIRYNNKNLKKLLQLL
jgi:hypothetical protein